MSRYDFKISEKKWQDFWDKNKTFQAVEGKNPYYVLEMFPYPSGTLHMGHARNYTIADIFARYAWAKGKEVLHPMGWDAFGLPAENAAIQNGTHPKEWTYLNAAIMKKQLQKFGFSLDWDRELFSCDPDYYKHEQRIFLDLYAHGLAYQKKGYVNWDPVDQSVLANEQVIDGKGWRSGAVVEKRLMTQWYLKITDFAKDLLEDLDTLVQWPEAVIEMQRNWIGQSHGLRFSFGIHDDPETFDVFSTRPETLYGISFCGLAPDHPLTQKWAHDNPLLKTFIQECLEKRTSGHLLDKEEKAGCFTGFYAQCSLFPEKKIPIYAINYVLGDYGTGAIFGCPAHDARDHSFACLYDLPIVSVLSCDTPGQEDVLQHSGPLDGLSVTQAFDKVQELLGPNAKKEVSYHLKDWCISRQRYWGAPIPIVHCPKCGVIPAQDLPVCLPDDVVFDGMGNPLARHSSWKKTVCPSCQGEAERETDTFDTFFESSWYFARFCDPHNKEHPFALEKVNHWMPVNQYIGGIEHAVLHLLYARFLTKALRQCGYWDFKEPFSQLINQGMVCHKTFKTHAGQWIEPKEVDLQSETLKSTGEKVHVGRSEKMSKSKKNVVSVDDMIEGYGADATRLFLVSDTPPSKDIEWSDQGIRGASSYIDRLWRLFQEKIPLVKETPARPEDFDDDDRALMKALHQTIDNVTKALESGALNVAIAHLRQFSNALKPFIPTQPNHLWTLRHALENFLRLLQPFVPHLAQDLAQELEMGESLHTLAWPCVDKQWLSVQTVSLTVQINGRTRGQLVVPCQISQDVCLEQIYQQPQWTSYLKDQKVKKIIFVPDRLINIVLF